MGAGCGIVPSEGKVFAPFDAKVEVLFETKHAIGLTGTDGESILIHIGIDTLNGKPFHNLVNQGDTVKKGDLLLTFDIDEIKKAGYDVTTPYLVTNAFDYDEITIKNDAQVILAKSAQKDDEDTKNNNISENNAIDTNSKNLLSVD